MRVVLTVMIGAFIWLCFAAMSSTTIPGIVAMPLALILMGFAAIMLWMLWTEPR